MQFMDDSLLPENQDPLVIQVAPYAPSFLPRDSDDIPVSMAEQVQKSVDCYNAGATVLHVHVREPDGKGSKRLEMFNEMLDRLRTAVPGMILQVGGSISFARPRVGRATNAAPATADAIQIAPSTSPTSVLLPTARAARTALASATAITATQTVTARGRPQSTVYVSTPASSASGARIFRPTSTTSPLKKLATRNQRSPAAIGALAGTQSHAVA